jgi:flagellar basal-body rod protein FlgC
MNPLKNAMAAAAQGMNSQSFRLQVTSENISNADTHGYQRKLVTFENVMDGLAASKDRQPGRVTLDTTPGELSYDPANPLANEEGYVTFSNVDLMTELADAREAGRSYEANLTSFQQARQMYGSLIDLLRR